MRLARLGSLGFVLACSALPGDAETAAINGAEIYYEIHGSGEPLLLLHGFNGSGQVFADFLDHYARRYRVILPDLRGHGRSTNPTDEFTHRQAALDIYALLDRLGIERFQGIGTSTGGMTLIHMATQQPKRVEAMILVGATIYFPEQAREIMRRSDADNLSDEYMAQARKRHVRGDEQIKALRRQFFALSKNYDDMNFTAPYLSTIEARTLIVHGDRDQFFPVNIPLEMYRSIPDSSLWIIPNGRHGPHRQHPEEFLRITTLFLDDELK